jgi:hypothetical protein
VREKRGRMEVGYIREGESGEREGERLEVRKIRAEANLR